MTLDQGLVALGHIFSLPGVILILIVLAFSFHSTRTPILQALNAFAALATRANQARVGPIVIEATIPITDQLDSNNSAEVSEEAIAAGPPNSIAELFSGISEAPSAAAEDDELYVFHELLEAGNKNNIAGLDLAFEKLRGMERKVLALSTVRQTWAEARVKANPASALLKANETDDSQLFIALGKFYLKTNDLDRALSYAEQAALRQMSVYDQYGYWELRQLSP